MEARVFYITISFGICFVLYRELFTGQLRLFFNPLFLFFYHILHGISIEFCKFFGIHLHPKTCIKYLF